MEDVFCLDGEIRTGKREVIRRLKSLLQNSPYYMYHMFLNIENLCNFSIHLCVLYDSQSKQLLIP
jgi:hypothetical protein